MKTQKILRKDLQTIYGQVCAEWQKKITEIVLWQSGDTIEVEDSIVQKAFGDADVKQRDMLKKHFKFVSGNIMDEIDSFEDIVRIAKEKYKQIYTTISETDSIRLSSAEVAVINANRQLDLIALVLNEGCVFDFNNRNQSKWTPWFERTPSGWVLFSYAYGYNYDSHAGVGPFFKDEKTALFAGKKFFDIFKVKLPA